MYDGSSDIPTRWPPGPDSWWEAVWNRDFPLMKDLGVNTLRLYSANPTTRQASIEQLGTNGIVEPYGKDHTQFMDKAAAYDFKVYDSTFSHTTNPIIRVFPLIGDYTLLMNTPEDQYKQWLRNQIDEVGNHSALLMWGFSNE